MLAVVLRSVLALILMDSLPGLQASSPAVQLLEPVQRPAPKHLTLVTTVSVDSAAPGSKLLLQLDITPKTGIHVYALGAEDYLPISLALDPAPGVKPADLKYPKPDTMVFEGEKVPVYDKPFRLVQEISLARSIQPGPLMIAGTVTYQACDDQVCFLPASAPVSWTITVK